MPISYDGNWTAPAQVGAKQTSLPLQNSLEYYATQITREMMIAATAYSPIIQNLTKYTNLALQSQAFTAGVWTATNTTVTDNAATAPDGTTTAATIMETATTAAHTIAQSSISVANASTVMSGIFQANGRTYFQAKFVDSSSASFSAFFNLNALGSVVSTSNCTAQIDAIGNGFYRWRIIFTPAAGAGTATISLSPDGTTLSYAGNTANGIIAWGFQVETAALAGPYVITTAATRSITSPPCDCMEKDSIGYGDPLAFLMTEGPPNTSQLKTGIADWLRTYARISRPTILGGSVVVTKPSIPPSYNYALLYRDGNLVLSGVAFQFASVFAIDGNAQSYFDVYPLKTPTAANNAPTGGTFTFTYKTSTTAPLLYNANASTVAAAINALASIIADGITVSVLSVFTDSSTASALQLSASVGTFLAQPTVNVSSMTGGSSPNLYTPNYTSTTASFKLYQLFTVTAHGWTNTGQNLGVSYVPNAGQSSLNLLSSLNWSVFNANTIMISPLYAPSLSNATVGLGAFTKRYVPGSYIVRAIVTTTYYLPGVTPGINAITDVVLPVFQGNTYDLLAAIFNNTGTINYIVGQLKTWKGSIYQMDLTTVNSADL